MKLFINTDGGSRGNPGPAGIGAIVKDEKGSILLEIGEFIGETTNNQAEYRALLRALKGVSEIADLETSSLDLEIRMDSELIVRQMQGRYKIKDLGLKPVAEEVLKLCKNFRSVNFSHVPREQNKEADKLVNMALDAALKV
ncbi:MAG: ribonuclease HI family protein [Candidatus Doudnabacteria bacterium]|nr:ribonuclease HI family protein [Candidatus Doudnabacteria bacterium]